MTDADELRALAKRLSDWPWQTIRGYCSRTGWIRALKQDFEISAKVLSAQADLLDELEKQEPVAWLYTDKRGMKFGPYLVRQAAGSTDIETPLYARPLEGYR